MRPLHCPSCLQMLTTTVESSVSMPTVIATAIVSYTVEYNARRTIAVCQEDAQFIILMVCS